jgi:peptidyl-prolyl cis-trans isomerase C
LVEFQAEVARYQSAQEVLGVPVTLEQATQTVQDDFINQLLLAQAAASSGFVMDDTALQGRIDNLAAQIGGSEALVAWETENGYTDETFRTALRRQITAAWMRDQIIASVPSTAEQVHVWQILLYNESEAQKVLNLLNNGASFADLATQYDTVTHGELGWFPRGYLFETVVEEAAFALQPGQYSGIVKSQVGYHILYLVEYDANHPLSPDALLALQSQALENWLHQKCEQSTIVLAP